MRPSDGPLGPCAWDVLKNALTLRMGDASAAYLLAATTKTMWDSSDMGRSSRTHRADTSENALTQT